MNVAARIARYEIRDVSRGRWLIVYVALLFGLAQTLLALEADVIRSLAGLINLVLIVVPLVGLLFGTLYLYGARDFNRMLLAQPVGRKELFNGLYAGVALPLAGATTLGLGVPLIVAALGDPAALAGVVRFLAVTVVLTLTSVSLAFLTSVVIRDRAAGMGVAVLIWLSMSVLYDGILVAVASSLPSTALERPALIFTLLNPIDTARILLLMQFDGAALMGYTGAVFRNFFGGTTGVVVAFVTLGTWALIPLLLARRIFRRSDL
ncbi:MAG: ABC transporter permease subunit [Gemmatimonadota bacterium]